MRIDPDSINNFRRGRTGDSFLGIVHTTTDTLYLALARHDPRDENRPDSVLIPMNEEDDEEWEDRFSIINGQKIRPLPNREGHFVLAREVGISVEKRPGTGATALVLGNAYGFSIIKTGPATFRVGSFRSGFNAQDRYNSARPSFAEKSDEMRRTLEQQQIEKLLGELSRALLGRTSKSRGTYREAFF
jgi:hypothetical protein